MNIFALSIHPPEAARWHVDKHVVKMPIETAQMLCTVRHIYGGDDLPYKPTHIHDPCCKWVAESAENYVWLCILGIELCAEYAHRYNQVHRCTGIIQECLQKIPKRIANKGRTKFVQAMPNHCKMNNPVLGYRNYYLQEKSHLAIWSNRDVPYWWS